MSGFSTIVSIPNFAFYQGMIEIKKKLVEGLFLLDTFSFNSTNYIKALFIIKVFPFYLLLFEFDW